LKRCIRKVAGVIKLVILTHMDVKTQINILTELPGSQLRTDWMYFFERDVV
jgi:hypothetical protein